MTETIDYRSFHRGILIALPFVCLFWAGLCACLVTAIVWVTGG